MKISVLNYQTGEVDILENVPDEERLKTYFIKHQVQDALHKFGKDDDLICFIEAYLEIICHYHISEIDWMVISGVNFRTMESFQ